jgi:hypothetical protein
MAIAQMTHAPPQAAALAVAPAQPATQPGGPSADGERSRARVITPAETAALLCVQAKILKRWRGAGGGPKFIRLSSKTIRYRHDDIDAFVACRMRASTAAA